ncbi:hypothetical protein [Adonisia turfae]|uniref:hypothetical protein n=1 Tax=Adonisia turfae TaxID=2950184 RepID=UPI0013D080AE|nr:hypothetical protein [Adonisia turfae]
MGRASPMMMKLPELKRRTRQVWEALKTWKGGVVLQPGNCDSEQSKPTQKWLPW